MKATIYIDKSLTPRYSEKGWPSPPGRYFTHYTVNGETAETGQRAWQIYRAALEKAKAESVPFEIHTIFYPTLNACTTPDSFIEVEIGEVTVGWQWRPYDTSPWQDTNEYYATTVRCGGNPCAQVRKVARVKPHPAEICGDCDGTGVSGGGSYGDQDCMTCQGIGILKPQAKDVPDNAAHGYTEGADIIEMDGTRRQKSIGEMQEQLAAANARIKELEHWKESEMRLWGPIIEYCQNSSNARRLKIRLGDSISQRVLEILENI